MKKYEDYSSDYDVRDDMIRTLQKIYQEKAEVEWEDDGLDYAEMVKHDYRHSDIHKMLTDLMDYLREAGQDDFVMLKHPEIAEWYGTVLEKRRIEQVRAAAKEKFKKTFTKEEQKLIREMIRLG